jgi:hypothetical protein
MTGFSALAAATLAVALLLAGLMCVRLASLQRHRLAGGPGSDLRAQRSRRRSME